MRIKREATLALIPLIFRSARLEYTSFACVFIRKRVYVVVHMKKCMLQARIISRKPERRVYGPRFTFEVLPEDMRRGGSSCVCPEIGGESCQALIGRIRGPRLLDGIAGSMVLR